jgi:arsenite methyltransferase
MAVQLPIPSTAYRRDVMGVVGIVPSLDGIRMSDVTAGATDIHVSSQGHALTESSWLDVHFETARPEYEAILRSIGLRRGWHVLDAGCGGGSFQSLIAAEVGPSGRITAFDLAPESIAIVEARVRDTVLDCPVVTSVGNILALPFADDCFDAVWCANTVQYLSDDELAVALAELRRVVRPGGIVAIKEANGAIWNFGPGDPERMWRFLEATREADRQIHGILRTPDHRRWLEASGFEDVWQRTTLCERWVPLRMPERQFYGGIFVWVAQLAERAMLSETDHAYWRIMLNPDHPDHPMNQDDFFTYDSQTVVVGRVP